MGWWGHLSKSPSSHCMNMWGHTKAEQWQEPCAWRGLLLSKSGYTLAPQQNNPCACLGKRRNFILRNDKIFSQALSCFINACLIWGKRKLAEASMVVLYAVNWQCFGTKNNFCTRVLTASLSHFPSPATVCARDRREQRNSSTFTDGRAETRGL